jgi:cell division septal protein FtsQ
VKARRLGVLAGAGLLVLAPLWGPAVLRPFAFFRVRRIELDGVTRLAPETVVAALGLRAGASVWDRLGPLAARLRTVPGVLDAQVGRRLPGTLRVRVREVEPVALASGSAGLVPVGTDGRPLPYDPLRAPPDLPVVQRAEPPVVAALDAVRDADPVFFAAVASARPGPGGSVELDLEGGGVVRLALPVDAAVVQAVAAVERDLASRGTGWRELDGRYTGWVVVRGSKRGEARS